MLIVMAVIAVVAAFVVPRVGGAIANLKLRSAVRACSAVMRYAKSVAVSTQKEQRISFILKGDPVERDYYKYQKVSRSSGNEDENIDDINDEYEEGQREKTELKREEKRKELDAGISLSWRNNSDSSWEEEGEYEITFFSRGFASGGEIRFAFSDDGRAYILKIDPVTGRVKTSTEKE
ncbi:MAG: hypothetical protein JSV09_03895 [Thermoplasmata archaeon]|nr:MAG: hypothetical protein JSV09_03895 [Thermoplasmata archaeon]